MLELIDNPSAVMHLQDGTHVLVGGVEMVFKVDSHTTHHVERGYVYLTNADADHTGYEANCEKLREEHTALYPDPERAPFDIEFVFRMGGGDYDQYVKHLRASENDVAMMNRAKMADLLASGVYVIC